MVHGAVESPHHPGMRLCGRDVTKKLKGGKAAEAGEIGDYGMSSNRSEVSRVG